MPFVSEMLLLWWEGGSRSAGVVGRGVWVVRWDWRRDWCFVIRASKSQSLRLSVSERARAVSRDRERVEGW